MDHGVQLVAKGAGNDDNITGRVAAGHHSALHILRIVDIHVTVDDGDHLQIRECRKRSTDGVFGHAVARRVHLEHNMIMAAAMGHVDLLQSLHLLADCSEEICLQAQSLTIPDLATRLEQMEDRVHLHGDGFHADNPAVLLCGIVTTDFTEWPLRLPDIGQDLGFDHNLGISNSLHIDRTAPAQAGRLPQQIRSHR